MITEFATLNPKCIDADVIAKAAEIIKNGGLVVFPTETVYGLGADATNASAAHKVYRAKGRPSDNPLIIHIASPADAERYTYTSDIYYLLANKFMPGPLTVILPSKDTIPLATRGGLDTVAVRCPENEIANALIAAAGVPICAPSANISGKPSPTSFEHVREDMDGRCDMIIDGGDCDFGLESTIVKISEDGSLVILRPGRITESDLLDAGFVVSVADAVTETLREGEVALSPGLKYKHYAPKSELVLIDGTLQDALEYISKNADDQTAVISYNEDLAAFESLSLDLYDFGSRDDLLTQAHRLFKILRDTDKKDYSRIYAPVPTSEGVGLALYNRMIRAAAHKIIKL